MLQPASGKIGECEATGCDKTEPVKVTCHYGNMWFCEDCWAKEQAISKEHMAPEEQQKRVDAYRSSVESRVIETAKVIDEAIEVRRDIYNAATIAILDIKRAIDENPEVTNKPYRLAEVLTERFNHYKQVVFDANETIIDAGNNQQAIQRYLNQMANTLRAEEREKLKIADLNYKPLPPRAAKPKPITTSQTKRSTKFDKMELRKYAVELGMAEATLQMYCVAKGLTPEAAAKELAATINKAKTESENK